ncbi:MAG: hypothetical protein CL955_06440 [Erythrobacteraceae bacterium]|nr:hypothetical protein [Erythrobacteraceae bacterium]
MTDAELTSLANRAQAVNYVLLGALGIFGLTLIGEVLELVGVIDLAAYEVGPLEALYGVLLILHTIIFIVSVIVVCMWIYRAHANLRDYGIEGLEFSPGWAVGWYFIPLANLFKPFQAMKELYNTSFGADDRFSGDAPGNLGVWWGAWIIGNILGNVSMRISLMGDGSNMQVAIVLSLISSVCMIVSAYLLREIVLQVTEAQRTGLVPTQVFE